MVSCTAQSSRFFRLVCDGGRFVSAMGEVVATYYFPMYLVSVLTVGVFAALALEFVYY